MSYPTIPWRCACGARFEVILDQRLGVWVFMHPEVDGRVLALRLALVTLTQVSDPRETIASICAGLAQNLHGPLATVRGPADALLATTATLYRAEV